MDPPADNQRLHPVIVGVSPGQSANVVLQAARFAARFETGLVCAHVNPGRVATSEYPDGSMDTAPIDSDFADEREIVFDAGLGNVLGEILAQSDVPWRTVVIAGDVAAALGRLGETLDASMIVVGAHERSFSGTIQEFFNRSVGVNLVHRQLRPVVVIPWLSAGASPPPGANA